MSKTKLPGLKNIPVSVDPELRSSLQAMKEALAVRLGQEGDPLDRAITLRELIDSGMAKELKNKQFDPNTTTTDFIGSGDDIVNLDVPPAPVNLEASGAFTAILISWAPPAYGGHAFTEVFRSRDDAIGTAQLVTTTEASLATDEVGYNQEYYYWVRFVNTSGVRGPFNQTNGVKATTAIDIGAVLTQLSETLADLPGYSTLTGLIDAGTLVIRASSAPSTRTDGSSLQVDDIWLDTDDDQLYVRNSSNNAWVQARDGTLKADIDTLVAALNTSNSRSDTTLSAAIAAERVVRVTAEGANATSINSLTSTVNGVSSNVTTIQNAITNGTSAQAGFGIAVNANNAIAGMYLMAASDGTLNNNTSTSNIIFEADQVTIRNPHGSDIVPFTVLSSTDSDGNAAGVYIDAAFIKDAAIDGAQIKDATIDNAKITGTLDAAKIVSGVMSASRISGGVIQSTDLADGGSTVIDGGRITTGFISADRIASNSITAVKINTTDLVLPTSGGRISGASIGNFNNNAKRYAEITTVGTGAGFYHGYVRLTGSNASDSTSGDIDDAAKAGQVKTIHILFSDGTVNTTEQTGGTDTAELTNSSAGVIYRTPKLEHLDTSISESRLSSGDETANIPIAFRYTGTGTVKCYMFGQGDGATRQIGNADVRFVKFSAS